MLRIHNKQMTTFVLMAYMLTSCVGVQSITPTRDFDFSSTMSSPNPTLPEQISTPALSKYAFPEAIDPAKRYMFYLHGRIIEVQGIPAISPDFGEYEYLAILDKLSSYGFIVISEQRTIDTVDMEYAKRVTEQITTLLSAGVPEKNITVVGASKGAGITIFISNLLENSQINYVIMAICHPEEVNYLIENQIYLYGNILSIFDSVDQSVGSCQELFVFSEAHGISEHKEIILKVGTGHGILYQPLDEWIDPVVQWAKRP